MTYIRLKHWLPALLVAGSILLATGCLRDPVREHEQSREEAFELLTRGQQLKKQGDYILARDTLLQASQLSERPIIYYEIGNCYYHLDQYEQAAEYYRKALALAPDYSLARAELELVTAHLPPEPEHARETAEAEDDTGEPAPDAQREADTDEREGVVLSEPAVVTIGDPEAPARRTTPPARRSGPFGAMTQALAPGQPVDDGTEYPPVEPEQARTIVFPELAAGAVTDIEEETRAAEAAEDMGRFDEAALRWTRILNEDATNLKARLGLAHALQRTGRTRRAEEELLRAASFAPESADVHFQFGNYYVQVAEPARAKTSFDRALELDPDHLRARNNLAALHIQNGNPDMALQHIDLVLAEAPDFAPALLNRAIALDDAGRPASEVLRALEAYIRVEGNTDTRTTKWLADLRREAQATN